MKTDKVVFDTNYYIHLILNDKIEDLVYFYSDYNIEIYTCNQQIEELTAVLKRKKFSKYVSSSQKYLDFIKKLQLILKLMSDLTEHLM